MKTILKDVRNDVSVVFCKDNMGSKSHLLETISSNHLQQAGSGNNNLIQLFENKIDASVLITKKQLAHKLNISASYVDKLKAQKKIPFVKIGRCIRFNCDEVMAALNRNGAHYEK